jgi:hypothetical protein
VLHSCLDPSVALVDGGGEGIFLRSKSNGKVDCNKQVQKVTSMKMSCVDGRLNRMTGFHSKSRTFRCLIVSEGYESFIKDYTLLPIWHSGRGYTFSAPPFEPLRHAMLLILTSIPPRNPTRRKISVISPVLVYRRSAELEVQREDDVAARWGSSQSGRVS